jgi:hypothetical protein
MRNQKFTQGTTPFPNLDKTVYQLSELDVGTKCPDVTDTDSVWAKLNNKVVPVHTMKAYRWSRGIYPLILKLGTKWW